MGLKKALGALDNAVKDLTSLHVQTFSGEITSTIDGSQSYDNIRQLVKKASTNGDITLVAETLAQFDGDSYNFIKQELDDIPKLALEVHKNAVQSGIDTRLGLLTLFKDLF
ncbi:hypothetical protein L3073_10530 [Ancylomarina sp. DW003]|nr:hypothetical protein [Ancylomarina sp. DW003]MDE5422642.1 hypothetical protein [Ancylomarina sp. DW003]